jgi:hypothetical protein
MNAAFSAAERLAVSRECLRLALYQAGAPAGLASQQAADAASTHWLAALKTTPGARLLLDVAHGWWARQPLRLLMPLAAQAAQVALAPVAQRHPVGLVLGAAAVGATLVMARPWRWISATALLARFLPPLLSEVVKCTPTTTCHSPHGRSPR